MKRSLTITALGAAAALSLGLYLLEHEVRELERELDGLNRALLEEQQTIQVLRAEWSYLNQPERLQQLAVYLTEDLGLQGMAPHQVGEIGDLPLPEVPVPLAESGPGGGSGVPVPAHKPMPPLRMIVAEARGEA